MLSVRKFIKTTTFHTHQYFSASVEFEVCQTIVRKRKIAEISEDDPILGLISETKKFVNEFRSIDKIDPFFTRKSQQTTLAVCQCYYDYKWEYYTGRNSEISLPTGSMCSERAAISHAISRNLNLHLQHFKRISVIDLTGNHVGRCPCGVCREWLEKIQEVSADFCIVTFPDTEFELIREHFPANYPLDNADAEETELLLNTNWNCNKCFMINSGYSTHCRHLNLFI
eukprot:UN00519